MILLFFVQVIICSSFLSEINLELYQLKIWFDINKLSLNLEKTKFMLFGNCKSKTNLQILINDVLVERVNKMLGTRMPVLVWCLHFAPGLVRRGSQGPCPPPGTVRCRVGIGEGAWQRDCGVGLWHR